MTPSRRVTYRGRTRAGLPSGRHGFVLAFVVLMLFSVSVAAATGYLLVNSEFGMAKHSSDAAEALTVARAGLKRFVSEEIGVVSDSVTYAMGDGLALVTARKLFAQDSVTDMYYVRSEGTVVDIFAPNSPARRVVGAYAIHRRRPLAHHAVAMISANTIAVAGGGSLHGFDYNTIVECLGAGADNITGAIAVNSVTEANPGDVQGTPEFELWSGGYAEMRDSVGLRWDVLSDPGFPVEFDGVWPNFLTLPVDSFPLVRYTGSLSTGVVGRGVLIVGGTFDPGPTFSWDGIVIAGNVDATLEGQLRGLLVAGLDGPNLYPTVSVQMDVHYYSCSVYDANESLSYLELVPNTLFEAY